MIVVDDLWKEKVPMEERHFRKLEKESVGKLKADDEKPNMRYIKTLIKSLDIYTITIKTTIKKCKAIFFK